MKGISITLTKIVTDSVTGDLNLDAEQAARFETWLAARDLTLDTMTGSDVEEFAYEELGEDIEYGWSQCGDSGAPEVDSVSHR